jgi:acetyl-CoA acetyltransferase
LAAADPRVDRVAIVAAEATPVGRLAPRDGEKIDRLEHDVLTDVVVRALDGAGIDNTDVGSAVFTLPPANTLQLGFATFMCARLGLTCTGQVAEVVEMGITGGLAFDQAAADVSLGRADFALALGVSFQSATPPADAMEGSVRVVGDVDFQSPFGVTPISWYALDAARYLHETGATREDLAAVAVKSRQHALDNELAQFRQPLTAAEVLAARPIVEPLGLFDVPAIADGAICLVLTRESLARGLGAPYVTVRGRGFYHEGFHQVGDVPGDMTAFPAARVATDAVLNDASIEHADLDLAEIYAPCTITEVLVSEALGICERGRGGAAARDGETAIGGRMPLNTSGGCLSRGHPPSLTALYGMLELREQLLGRAGTRQVDGARLGLHLCELGNYNAALAHVLEGPA